MYWKEIPVQVQAEDKSGQVSKPLSDRFQKGVDAVSILDGSSNSDEYLEAWEWGPYADVRGSAEKAACNTAKRLNENFPQNFVARIRDLHSSGDRNPKPGAIDHWADDDAA